MTDLIIVLVVAVILLLAGIYIYRTKKSGKKCIGCPYADKCGADNISLCCGSCYVPDDNNDRI